MVKKFYYSDRKRLLEARENGSTDDDLKKQFDITDIRTIRRQIKLAEQEQEARLVKVEILKDALSNHHVEVRSIIKEWKASINKPLVRDIYSDMTTHPTQGIENKPLFKSVREHLPFPTLWRDYSMWVNKVEAYIDGCKNIIKKVGAARVGNVNTDMLKQWHDNALARSESIESPQYMAMAKEYLKKAKLGLTPLEDEINNLEGKLHESIQEILLRRDYIMYTCKLCPGQPRMIR
ncbi:hypothetical protein ACFLYB_03230 [Chloroflexota bacterium]